MIIIYGIPNCDIVRKSLNWFKDNKIAYQFHNFKTQDISRPKLSDWINKVGLDNVVNKRSTTWRNLPEQTRQAMEDKSKAIEILMTETSIIKRPVVESAHDLVIGFNEQEYLQKFTY